MVLTARPLAHALTTLNVSPPLCCAVRFHVSYAFMLGLRGYQSMGGAPFGAKSVHVAVGGIHTGGLVGTASGSGV